MRIDLRINSGKINIVAVTQPGLQILIMPNELITNCRIVNEGLITESDIRIKDGRIATIATAGTVSAQPGEHITDAKGRWLFPGLIDDQVHFRAPGLTHKADIASESRAAVAGGITSYMEMPNVNPPTLTMALLEEKRQFAAAQSLSNYAFYLGAANDNIEDIAAADPQRIAGIKIFMGASTGNMLVDDPAALAAIFARAPTIIATHCENSRRIATRFEQAQQQYGDDIPAAAHAIIRDEIACYESSSQAIALAKEHNARLHILHITTAKELSLFSAGMGDKQITCEACAHHLLFDESDYATLGMRLKCNPAVKSRSDRDAIRQAVATGQIDVLATDHAPHLLAEKELPYAKAAAGLPLVEYALPAFLELVADGVLTFADVARASAHRVADIFAVRERGYIREGYWADLTLVEETAATASGVRDTVLAKCAWTPFRDYRFRYRVANTWVNGNCVWANEKIREGSHGMALAFDR